MYEFQELVGCTITDGHILNRYIKSKDEFQFGTELTVVCKSAKFKLFVLDIERI